MEERKDIVDKLYELGLRLSWGTIDRVCTAETTNGIPKNIAIIQEAIAI